MKINDAHISDFKALYKKHYGNDLSREDATIMALRLLQLLKAFQNAHKQSNGFTTHHERKT